MGWIWSRLPLTRAFLFTCLVPWAARCSPLHAESRSPDGSLKEFSICSGDLSSSKLSLYTHGPVDKICASVIGDTATLMLRRSPPESPRTVSGVTVSRSGRGVITLSVDQREVSHTDTGSAAETNSEGVRYELQLTEKFVIRDEGVLSLHFLGTLRVIGLSADRPVIDSIEHLHFYNASPVVPIHWGYVPPTDPAQWGKLEGDFEACSEGKAQSPINLQTAATVKGKKNGLTFQYRTSRASLVNNGHALQVNVGPGNTLYFGGKEYELLQFHVHVPSEHTVDGVRAPIEFHFVHRSSPSGALLVVSVLGAEPASRSQHSSDSSTLERILREFPAEENAPVEHPENLNPLDLLPTGAESDYLTYSGSLTTPPCTEGVQWVVLRPRVTVDQESITRAHAIIRVDNARRIDGSPMPILGRVIERSSE